MNEQTKPEFQDILNLISELPDYPEFTSTQTDMTLWLQSWLLAYSRILNLSKGFSVNRCALYWTGYDAQDGFDGQAFVDSCRDTKGSLNQLASILDTDLQIFELSPNNTTKPTLDELTMAASYGMMGVEENTQLFCACSFGQGVESASQDALDCLKNNFDDLESFIVENCGLDHAAMLGAAIACILKGIPMILEGTSGQLVKVLLEKTAGKAFPNVITTDDLKFPDENSLPAHDMVLTAVIMKSLMAYNVKTDCGKIKVAA